MVIHIPGLLPEVCSSALVYLFQLQLLPNSQTMQYKETSTAF